jgi:dihydroorotate dehydrogenase (fumarate)
MAHVPDLFTTYLGITLSSPVIASAGPLTREVESMLRLEAAGAGAIVLPSLFQEEAEAEEMQAYELFELGDGFAEFASAPLPEVDPASIGPGRHIKLLRDAKEALKVPVFASLNGTNIGGWSRYAAEYQDAGADALELNLYSVNADPSEEAAIIENRYLAVIEAVRAAITIPLSVKVSPHFSSFSNFAARARSAGADGFVLFSGIYGTDIDLEKLKLTPAVPLTSSDRIRLPMRWIGILDTQLPKVGLAASSGVHTWQDVLKLLLVGADVACTTSAVLRHGPEAITAMLDGLRTWMADHEYDSVVQLRGSMNLSSVGDPGAYERDVYIKTVTSTPVIV